PAPCERPRPERRQVSRVRRPKTTAQARAPQPSRARSGGALSPARRREPGFRPPVPYCRTWTTLYLSGPSPSHETACVPAAVDLARQPGIVRRDGHDRARQLELLPGESATAAGYGGGRFRRAVRRAAGPLGVDDPR